MMFSNLKYTTKDVIQLMGIGAMFITQYYSLKGDIKELAVYKTADDKIVNSRLDKLEIDMSKLTNRMNETDRNIYKLSAILPKEIRLKEEE